MAYEYILIKTRYGRRTISDFFRAITKRNKFERSQIGAVEQLTASSTTVVDFPIGLFVFMCGDRFGCSLESEEELKSLITMLSETLMTIPLSAPLLSSLRSCLPFDPLCCSPHAPEIVTTAELFEHFQFYSAAQLQSEFYD